MFVILFASYENFGIKGNAKNTLLKHYKFCQISHYVSNHISNSMSPKMRNGLCQEIVSYTSICGARLGTKRFRVTVYICKLGLFLTYFIHNLLSVVQI